MATLTEKDVKTYNVDPAHSRVGFTARHMGFTKVRGSFEDFEGVIHLDPSDLSTFEAEGTIRAKSITTRESKRDEHLRSADFFDVENEATISFKTTEVKDVSGSSFTIAGDLTIRGTTRPVELEAEFNGEGTDPWGGTRIGIEAHTKINRKDYGLKWNAVLETGGVLVGEEVELTLDIQAVEQSDDE